MENLNDVGIPNHDWRDRDLVPEKPMQDYSTLSLDGLTSVYFRNIERRLIRHIEEADRVVGCVAWLTSFNILRALAKKRGVAIVVQKEDFLRPDLGVPSDWKRNLRKQYENLPSSFTRFDNGLQGTILHSMSTSIDDRLDSVRCVGNYNATRNPAFPRAHHKFVVFCKDLVPDDGIDREELPEYVPYAVWTGSFNFTKNAGQSLENAVVLRDPAIVRAYYQEFGQVAAISEPLDWETIWIEPEWRIGT